jgi:hypothetical protein
MAVRHWDLSAAEFRTALQRGLGRALIHAQTHPLTAEHRTALLETAFEPASVGFNSDGELARWLLDVAASGGVTDEMVKAVLQAATAEMKEADDAVERLCALLRATAQRGYPDARSALYGIVRRFLKTDGTIAGWQDVWPLDGPRAFVEIAADIFTKPQLVRRLVDQSDSLLLDITKSWFDVLSLSDEDKQVLRGAIDAVEAERAQRKADREAWLADRGCEALRSQP